MQEHLCMITIHFEKSWVVIFIGKNVKKISIVANVFPHLYNKITYKYEAFWQKGLCLKRKKG